MKKIFIIVALLLINISIVNAKDVNVNDLSENLKYNEYNNLYNVTSKIDEDKLIVNNNGKVIEFNISNNVLTRKETYNKNDIEIAKDMYIYLSINKIVASLKGYSNKDIEYFLTSLQDASLNKNGYELKRRYINNEVELTYTIDLNNFKLRYEYNDEPMPEVVIKEVNKDSVLLQVLSSVNKVVDIYRSTDNKNYEYLTSLEISDGTSSLYIDDNLDSSKYFYKAVVAKSNNYSLVKEVTLKNNVSDKRYVDEKTENPLTGEKEFIGVSLLIIIAIIGIINNINLKKKVYR